jgi:hypothetical protein
MARIFDNIEIGFVDGLKGLISNLGVKKVDFCVGYFNLRGWNLIVDQVDKLTGDYVYENVEKQLCFSPLLIVLEEVQQILLILIYFKAERNSLDYIFSYCLLLNNVNNSYK